MTEHPDFLAADEAHRWTKPLHELAVRLREGAWKVKGGWVYWLLPAGACVAMRVVPHGAMAFRKELRLSRRGILKQDHALWEAEVAIFKRHLGCEGWARSVCVVEPEVDRPTTFRAVCLLLEPAALGATVNVCSRCGAPTPHEPAYKADLCTACALKAGQADVVAKRGAAAVQATLDLPPYPGGGEIEPRGGEPT